MTRSVLTVEDTFQYLLKYMVDCEVEINDIEA